MGIISTVVGVIWVLYVIGSLIKKNWNDFLYGSCMLLVIFLPIPLIQSIILMVILIYVHHIIDKNENQRN
jgi:biotin transporter BioY